MTGKANIFNGRIWRKRDLLEEAWPSFFREKLFTTKILSNFLEKEERANKSKTIKVGIDWYLFSIVKCFQKYAK